MNNKIGVFDSGIGGLSILNELKTMLPHENFLYYGDSKNCPYGEKSDEELFEITSKIVCYLKSEGCRLIVIACNTATTRCMKKLRETFNDLIFVGCVPAIKLACDQEYKNILVMATPATIESERTHQLVKDNIREDQKIYLVPCFGLADAIEKNDSVRIKNILNNIFFEYKDKNIDSIVLGCTHYPFIKKEILVVMPNVTLLDGSKGVAREVRRQLESHNLLNKSESTGKVTIYNSLDESVINS